VWRPTVERVLGGVAPHLMVTDPPYGVNCDPAIAIAHLAARRFELAIEWADRALHDQPRTVPAMRVKAIALAHLGDTRRRQRLVVTLVFLLYQKGSGILKRPISLSLKLAGSAHRSRPTLAAGSSDPLRRAPATG